MALKKIVVPIFNGHAIIVCPTCDKVKEVRVNVGTVKGFCPNCSTKFIVHLHKGERKYFRKQVCIDGYAHLLNNKRTVPIVVGDLSCQGTKFRLKHNVTTLVVGAKLKLNFELPDKKNTNVKIDAVVRRVNADDSYSVEFVGVNEYSTVMKAIGFCLRC